MAPGLSFLLLALQRGLQSAIDVSPLHNSFLSLAIEIIWSFQFVLPSLSWQLGTSATAMAPCMQQEGEAPVDHIQEYLKVSAASSLQPFQCGIKSFHTRKMLCAYSWQSWDGVLNQADRLCCQLPHHCSLWHRDTDSTVERKGGK